MIGEYDALTVRIVELRACAPIDGRGCTVALEKIGEYWAIHEAGINVVFTRALLKSFYERGLLERGRTRPDGRDVLIISDLRVTRFRETLKKSGAVILEYKP